MALRTTISALLFASLTLFAQSGTGQLRGRVVNSRDGQTLGLVQVQLTGTRFRAVTGDDGTFHIDSVPAGSYALQASAVDFYQARQEFTLASGETKEFEIVLSSSNSKRTDSVDVTAGAFEGATETSASAITLEGDERKNLASVLADDPLRAVQGLPGVASNNDFSSEFSIRGASFDRIGLYLDGILLHSPFHTVDGQPDNGSLTIFNGDMVDQMTLFEGAWPVGYGDRTAGILAVNTRDGSRDGIRARVGASMSNAGVMLEGPFGKSKRGSWLVDFRKSYLQYILNRIDFGNSAPLAFGFTDGQARLSYDLTDHHNLSVSYIEGASTVDRSRFQSQLSVNSILDAGFRYSLINLGSRYNLGNKLLVTNHVAWERERGEVGNPSHASLFDQTYTEGTWRGDATVSWSAKANLEFGGQLRHLKQDGLSQLFVRTPALVPSVDSFHGSGNRTGAYVQQAVGLVSNRIRMTLGVREDNDSVSPVHLVSPYASVTFQPMENTRILLDWGQYAQYPELSQMFSAFSPTRLLPERATHYEAALEQKLAGKTRLRFEVYDRQDRDLIARPLLDVRLLSNGTIFNPIPNAPWQNSQRGYSQGGQIYLQRRSANGFTGWISYAYGRTLVSDGQLGLSFPSNFDQGHSFNAYVSRRLRPTVNLSGRFTYGSGMPLPGFYQLVPSVPGGYAISKNRNTLRAPAYQRTDVRLNKAFAHKKTTTTLYAEVINLTNHNNRDFESPGPYNSSGRTFPNFYSMFPILPSVGAVFEF
jgi:hypothetical protein